MVNRSGNSNLFTAAGDRDNQAPDLAGSLSLTELDVNIKKLTLVIEAVFLSRARFSDEFARLRALLNAQLARAQTLVDELPLACLPSSPASSTIMREPATIEILHAVPFNGG